MNIQTVELNKPLSSVVYENILCKLIMGVYSPGDIVNRKKIAEELKVSLAPISEAIMLLEYEGFLIKYPRQGTLVRKARWKDLKNQFYLISLLSSGALDLINRDKFNELLPELKLLAEKADLYDLPWRERWHSEIDFHARLISATNNKAIVNCFKKEFQLYQFFKTHLIIFGNNEVHDHHVDLLDALKNPDINIAKKAMEHHFRTNLEPLLKE